MSDALRRALRTAAQTFVGVFSLTLLGFLSSVQEWAGGTAADFPSVNPLGKAAVGAAAAVAAGLVSFAVNALEDSPKVRFPALLKAEASSGVNPVTVDPPAAPVKKAVGKRAPEKKAAAKKR